MHKKQWHACKGFIKTTSVKYIVGTMLLTMGVTGMAFAVSNSFAQEYGPPAGYEGQMPSGDMGGQDKAAEMEKMQAEMEARGKAMQAKGFKMAQSQLKKFQPVYNKLAARITTLEKQGVKVSDETKTLVSTLGADLTLVLAATSFDDEGVEEALDRVQENGQALQEIMPKLEQLAHAPKLLKQAKTELTKLSAAYKRTETLAKSIKIDVSSLMTEFSQILTNAQMAYDSVSAKVAAGEVENVYEEITEQIFDKLSDGYQIEATVKALKNVASQIKQMEKFLANMKKVIDKQEKAKKDVTAMRAAWDDLNTKATALKVMVTSKITDMNALRDQVDATMEAQNVLGDLMDQEQFGPVLIDPNSKGATKEQQKDMQDFETFKKFDLNLGVQAE